MVGCVATIAEKQDIFILGSVADGARSRVLLLLLDVLA
jgi:hypothetical protein